MYIYIYWFIGCIEILLSPEIHSFQHLRYILIYDGQFGDCDTVCEFIKLPKCVVLMVIKNFITSK